jgi:hypothetical protein
MYPDDKVEYCISRLHPTNPDALLIERCTEHRDNKVKYLKSNNALTAKYIWRS